ncbi:MAG: ABC transporter permease [Saprospiraceae bacterium]|nr:ABC transporter permease [Saprospiraceae bacterium]MBP7680050.1 ABC transporter permease [Saprospiraceae bacterium]
MSFASFIAKRIAFADSKSLSYVIIRIATASVALSVAVMLIATSLVAGFKKEISAKIFGFWGHIHITDTAINRSFEAVPVSTQQNFYSDNNKVGTWGTAQLRSWAKANQINLKGEVRHLQTYALKPGIIKTKKELEGIVLKGVGRDFDWDFLKQYLVSGTPIPQDSTDRYILISNTTANRLNVKVGSKFIVYFEQKGDLEPLRFTVCGIYKTGLDEYDKKLALTDIHTIRNLLGWQPDQVAGFEVFLDNIQDMEVVNQYLYQEVIPETLYCETIRERNPGIFEWLDLQDVNEIVILVLMLIVCIINMTTSILILILERTNMIGILKAMGSNNWQIRKIFLHKATYIIGVGLLWGNIIGIGLLLLQRYFTIIKLPEEDYYLSYAPVNFDVVTIAAINVGTLLVTLLFLLIPSYIVTRITPVRAIRFK